MLEGGVNHERFGQRQEKRGFRQEKGNHREGRLLLARQLKLVLGRSMRLMLTVVVLVILAIWVIMGVNECMCAGCCAIIVMHLCQEMNPHIIDVVRKYSHRQQANPPPTRSRAFWQSALLT